MNWGGLHVGDVVRGADGGAWTVAKRTPGPRWVLGGDLDHFTLRHNGREVRTTQKLTEPAPLVAAADHTEQAHAWQALTGAGFQLTYLGESTVTDEFTSPAPRGDDDDLIVGGRYKLPHPVTGVEGKFTRVSNVSNVLADGFGLHRWEMRMVLKGVGLRPDLAALAAALDVDEDKGKLDDAVKQAKSAAAAKRGANNGTAFHKFCERHDKGEALASMAIPDAFAADVRAYAEALKARRIKVLPQFMECIVFVPELEICGTLDRIVMQPAGPTHSEELAILDLKSGKDLSYSWMEIAAQQACYANASHIWDRQSKQWFPMPPVDKSRALIAHSPIGKGVTTIYGVDLVKGWTLAKTSMKTRAWRKDTYSWLVEPDPASLALHLVSQAATQQELAALWDRFHPAGHWTDEVHAAAGARWEQIHAPEPATV